MIKQISNLKHLTRLTLKQPPRKKKIFFSIYLSSPLSSFFPFYLTYFSPALVLWSPSVIRLYIFLKPMNKVFGLWLKNWKYQYCHIAHWKTDRHSCELNKSRERERCTHIGVHKCMKIHKHTHLTFCWDCWHSIKYSD